MIIGDLLRPLEEPKRLVVARLCAAHARMQSPHRLDVVVEHVGPSGEHRLQRLFLDVQEVRRQHLDRRLRELCFERSDRGRVMSGAAVGDVIPVDRRDDDMLELHLRRDVREPQRLERVRRCLGLAAVHVAVAARARACVAEDLERRRAATPALGDVRAARLLADRVQARAVDQLFDVEVA